TPDQAASLKDLENQDVDTIINAHFLSKADTNAVQTWARNDALAELYALLVKAVNATAADRTTDQQNAVDWLSGVAQRENVEAAEAAGREYVEWAGLNKSTYNKLVSDNTKTQSDLETFLSGNPETVAWCSYRSPAPYSDDYKGYNATVCFNPQPCL